MLFYPFSLCNAASHADMQAAMYTSELRNKQNDTVRVGCSSCAAEQKSRFLRERYKIRQNQ